KIEEGQQESSNRTMTQIEVGNLVALKEVDVTEEVNEVLDNRETDEDENQSYSSPAPRIRWNQCAKTVTPIVITAADVYAIGRLNQSARLTTNGSSKTMRAPVHAMTAAPT